MAAPPESTQNERLAVIEKQLDNVVNLLNVELRHLRETMDRYHGELSEDLKHSKANQQQVNVAVDKRFEAYQTKAEISLMRQESERRWAGQIWYNRIIGTTAFTSMSTLIFMLAKHLLGA